MSFGAFNKRSSTTQSSNTTSQGIAQSEVSGTASGVQGNNNTTNVTTLDGGAIKDAFGFGSAALDFATRSNSQSLDIAGEVSKESIAIAANATAKAVSDESDKIADLAKWLIGGAVVIGAALMLKEAR